MIDIMENEVLGPAIRRGIAEGEILGRAEGKAEGEAEGECLLLSRQLTRRFGQPPRHVVERIEKATESELMTWADRVLTATCLAEVFTDC